MCVCFFKSRLINAKQMGRCPLRLREAIPPAADMHSVSQLKQKSWCPLAPFGLGGQGQTSYLLYLYVDNNSGVKKCKEVSEMNFGYSIPKEETNKFCFQAQTVWLFPAQTTILKETSWSEGFNEFSTPYRILWICIIWTIFLEVIFPSGAQHFICMNASAWVIPASKLCMYKRGPGVWTKTYSIFLLFPVAYLGKVCVSFVQEKITEPLSLSPGTKTYWTISVCTVLCPAEWAGWGAAPHISHLCCGEGCSVTVLHTCSTLTRLMNLWPVRSPACTLCRGSGAALGTFIKVLLSRRLSGSLWMDICSPLCLHLPYIWAMPTNRSLFWQLQRKGKPGRAQEGIIHQCNHVLKENSPLVLEMGILNNSLVFSDQCSAWAFKTFKTTREAISFYRVSNDAAALRN